MGISAAPHRRQVRVIGPLWPTANRPTIECAAQIRVVRTSRRIGLAQADCMSPVLGAVASVMNVFGGFEGWSQFALGRKRSRTLEIDPGAAIGRAGADGNPTKQLGSEDDGPQTPQIPISLRSGGGLARLSPERLTDRFAKRLGFFARASRRVDESHARQGQFRQPLGAPEKLETRTDHRGGQYCRG